jgi:hypothetical protein
LARCTRGAAGICGLRRNKASKINELDSLHHLFACYKGMEAGAEAGIPSTGSRRG